MMCPMRCMCRSTSSSLLPGCLRKEADVFLCPCLAEEHIELVEHGPLDGVQGVEQALVHGALQHEVGHHLEVLLVLGQVGDE